MTLQQIRYFIEVAREMNFSRAAENLFVAQPGLSRAISNLEQELGVSLFIRSGNKKIFLTSYGEIFLEYANSVVETLDNAVTALDQLRVPSPLSGEVRLGYGYVMGYDVISTVFHDFAQDEPARNIAIQFDVKHDDSDSLTRRMLAGEYDLVLTGREYTKDEGLCSKLIAHQKLYVVVAADHRLAGRERVTFEDIRNEQVIGPSVTCSLSDFIRRLYEQHGYKPSYSYHIGSWPQRVLYTALGRGITILPKLNFNPEKTVAVELDDPLNVRPVYITWPSSQYRMLSPAAVYVRDFCVRRYESLA